MPSKYASVKYTPGIFLNIMSEHWREEWKSNRGTRKDYYLYKTLRGLSVLIMPGYLERAHEYKVTPRAIGGKPRPVAEVAHLLNITTPQEKSMTVNELLTKYDADNITELSGKLLNAALKTEAMQDLSELSQSMWTEQHPDIDEAWVNAHTKLHPLNAIAWIWHSKGKTVTTTREEPDPR